MDTRENKRPFHVAVAEKLVEQLKKGTAPWQKPWDADNPGLELPMNPVTGKRYRGINVLHLMSEGRDDPRWMTYRQAVDEGAQVRRGEKGTSIQYWKFSEEKTLTDDQGKAVLDARGEPLKEQVKLERPRVFFATVFNAEQMDGLPAIAQRKEHSWDPIERAERILQVSGAAIEQDQRDRAFYRSATDTIHLPEKSRFPSADNFYATALHELGHWTGHHSRLNRDLVHPFGSEGYAKEELRAEIASMILGVELGIGHDPQQHTAYVASWIKVLQDDPLEIFRAASDAEKIQDYLLGLEVKLTQEQSHQEQPAPLHAEHPSAFVDSNGLLREWNSGDVLPAEWEGLVKHQGAYWFAGHEAGVRSQLRLDADSIQDARLEAARASVLQVDIGEVLHSMAAFDNRADTNSMGRLETAMRDQALHTIVRVTGLNPVRFVEVADERLSRALGVSATEQVEGSARREKEELVRIFADSAARRVQTLGPAQGIAPEAIGEQDAMERAEAWTLRHLGQATLEPRLDKATPAQLRRVEATLVSMEPFDQSNPFWQRHPLPDNPAALAEQVHELLPALSVRQLDIHVAAARLELAIGRSFGRERAGDVETFEREAGDVLGFRLPLDWTGGVQVKAAGTERTGEVAEIVPAEAGREADAWSLYAQHPDGTYEWIADRASENDARLLAERLALIDAHSTINEMEKAAKLMRMNEARVQRDPNSTDDDIAAATIARKEAEGRVQAVDDSVQRRVDMLDRDQQATTGQTHGELVKLAVPFKEKDDAKALGAKWDRGAQSWYVPPGLDLKAFEKWLPSERSAAKDKGAEVLAPGSANAGVQSSRIYLAVPYADRIEAKTAGALWDKAARSWYAGPQADMSRLDKWKPENVRSEQAPAMNPRDEFAEALRSVGCVLSGDHPVMDGKHHRISVEGEKYTKNSGAGFYFAYLDGHPAGYVKNNKTGQEQHWKAMGYAISPEEKAKFAAEAAAKMREREDDRQQRQEQAAQRVAKQVEKLVPIDTPTPYLLHKGIEPAAGILTDKDGKKTFIPAYDVNGKQWTMQTIQEDGTKRYAKDSRKDGCFHVVGGLDALAKAPALVIGEGYATAATLQKSLGFATVAALDAGNLAPVAQALHQKYPGKPVLIAGDDDRHLQLTQGSNPGRKKAQEAANLVGGRAIFPVFAVAENTYPMGAEPITPQKYRGHKQYLDGRRSEPALSDVQLAMLDRMKQHTDFNDLATKSKLGESAVDRQLKAALRVLQEPQRKTLAQQAMADEPEAKKQRKTGRTI